MAVVRLERVQEEEGEAVGGINLFKFIHKPGHLSPPPDDRRPPPPGWNPPPSYDETCGSSSSSTGRSGPGFYSGLGLGALGGYFFGRNTGYGGYGSDYRYRGRSNYYDSGYDGASSSYTYDGPSTSSTSGSTHTSTSNFITKQMEFVAFF